MRIQEEHHGENSIETAVTLNNLGVLYAHLGIFGQFKTLSSTAGYFLGLDRRSVQSRELSQTHVGGKILREYHPMEINLLARRGREAMGTITCSHTPQI